MSTVTPTRSIPRLRIPVAVRGTVRAAAMIRESILFVAAALCYFAVRGITEGSAAAAHDNAEALVRIEAAMGLAREEQLQDLIIDVPGLVPLVNWIYIWGHWPLIAGVAVWLYLRRPAGYRLMRNAIFISGGIGIVIFALLPVMPPRLGVMEVVDTVSANSQAYRALQPPELVNQFAAFPSLHVGFNLIVAVVLWRVTSSRLVRAFAVTSVAGMSVAVVLTANHYLLDIPAGMLVALVGLAAAVVITRPPDEVPAAPARGRVPPGRTIRASHPIRASQARVLDLDTAVHDHRDSRLAGPVR